MRNSAKKMASAFIALIVNVGLDDEALFKTVFNFLKALASKDFSVCRKIFIATGRYVPGNNSILISLNKLYDWIYDSLGQAFEDPNHLLDNV